MTSRNGLIVLGIVLQVAMVLAGHWNATVLGLSAVLGVGIPLVLGAVYGASGPTSAKDAMAGGFLIGLVGAVLGVLLAILLGDALWSLLTFAPLSSAVAGLLGAIALYAIMGKK